MDHFHISCVLCSYFIKWIVKVKILTQPQYALQSFLSKIFVHISNNVCKVHVYANFLKICITNLFDRYIIEGI